MSNLQFIGNKEVEAGGAKWKEFQTEMKKHPDGEQRTFAVSDEETREEKGRGRLIIGRIRKGNINKEVSRCSCCKEKCIHSIVYPIGRRLSHAISIQW